MLKKLFSDSIIYGIGDFLVVAVSGLFLLPYYTRMMTIEEYAIYGVFSASIAAMTFIVHFGIISTFVRCYFLQKSNESKEIYTGQVMLIHFTMAFIILLLAFLFKDFILNNILVSVNANLYSCIVLISIFSFLNAIYSGYLRVIEKPKQFLMLQLTTVFLYTSLIFVFQFFNLSSLNSVVLALLSSTFFIWCISLIKLPYKFSFFNLIDTARSTFTFAFPIFIAYIMYFCINKYNVLFLQNFVDKEQLGYFTFALQLSAIIVIVAGAIGKAIQPALYKLSGDNVINASRRLALYYKSMMLIISAILILFSNEIILLVAPQHFLGSEFVFRILILSSLIYNFRTIEASLFYYFNKPRYSLYITFFSALTVIVLSISFVPKFGITASAYSILAGSTVSMLCNMFICKVFIEGKGFVFKNKVIGI
ncbi:lipopolysaccharide biosynthesis protein [Psychromonas aquimarina]|uniref:lipopolysaccharide biosynthesis protein n=1 Tax=Psychromonas aquimarina TaxID=444919 RepID=UPI00041F9922|nr:oligosaccharide flippase family protein [Psychromonas aquimarina]